MLTGFPAGADEFASCWVAREVDPVLGRERTVTRCRISGGEVVDYASDDSVPARLYPSAGTDITGECWYLTSSLTNWVYLALYIDGDAELGYDPDLSTPGGIAVATSRIPRCTSEPGVGDPSTEAWQYVTQYVHPPPTPEISPPPGNGVTGMETFVGVPVPAAHNTQMTSVTGTTMEIHIEVSGVEVDWGDDRTDSFPADPVALAGYPDGVAAHVYEVKAEPGYLVSVSYAWVARWRVSGGDWEFLDVPPTTTSVAYPVAEIVSVITE